MKKIIGFLIIILSLNLSVAQFVNAQKIRNLGFDKPSIVNPKSPFGWTNVWEGHQLSLDSLNSHSGKFSLESHALSDDTEGFGLSMQHIPEELIQGNNLKVSVWIRNQDITKGEAMIRLFVFDKNQKLINKLELPDPGVHGTSEWKRYSADLKVNKSADIAFIQMYQKGNGKVWFDDVEILINGKKYVPSSKEPWIANKKEIGWLKKNIIPLTTDNPDARFTDLKKLQSLFDEAKIIGLGENTHGSRNFFRMKHRLTKWITSQNDTTVFVIEASMPEARAINQYVLHGNGNPKKLLANLHFWTWNTEEVLNLIKWMRTYNQSDKGQIEFWGCDMQYPNVAADSVRAFIKRADPSYLAKLNQSYQSLSGPDNMRGMSQQKLDTLYRNAMSVYSHLRENKRAYLNAFDSMQVEWAIQNARIVEQSIARFLGVGKTRDRSMAENIKWIDDHHTPKAKILIWAHNDHLGRGSTNMGYYLNTYFENKYRPVAFAFGQGSYSAVLGPAEPVKRFPAPAPKKGSVEYVMHQLDTPKFTLDLRKAHKNTSGKWLASPKLFRSIGSLAEDLPYKKQSLAESFDALIYFDQITASHSYGRPKTNSDNN